MFECDKCSLSFSRNNALLRHKKDYHSKNSRPYECDDCKENFTSALLLLDHKKNCTAAKSVENEEEIDLGISRLKQELDDYSKISYHDINTLLQCKACMECFTDSKKLIDHTMNTCEALGSESDTQQQTYSALDVKSEIVEGEYEFYSNGNDLETNEEDIKPDISSNFDISDLPSCQEMFKGIGGHNQRNKGSPLLSNDMIGEIIENTVKSCYKPMIPSDENKPHNTKHKDGMKNVTARTQNTPMLTHMLTHKNNAQYRCECCYDCFVNVKALLDHKKICPNNFNLGKIMVQPKNNPNSGLGYDCPECGRNFTNAIDLKRHKTKEHFKAKPFQCEFCMSCFSVIGELLVHKTMCTKLVYKVKAVRDKELSSTPSKQFTSDAKTKIKKTELEYKQVSKSKEPSMSLTHPCSECGRVYPNKVYLQRHKTKEHFTAKPFQCESCSTCFSKVDELLVHKRMCSKEKKVACDVKSEIFDTEIEPPIKFSKMKSFNSFQCENCEKRFSYLTPFENHIKKGCSISIKKKKKNQFDVRIKQENFTFTFPKQEKEVTTDEHSKTPKKETYQCEFCLKKFSYLTCFNNHEEKGCQIKAKKPKKEQKGKRKMHITKKEMEKIVLNNKKKKLSSPKIETDIDYSQMVSFAKI